MTTTNTKSNVASSTRCDQYLHLLHQTNLVQKSPMYIPLLVNSSHYQQIQTRYSHLTHHHCRTLKQIQQHYRDNPTSNLYSTSITDASNGIVRNISVFYTLHNAPTQHQISKTVLMPSIPSVHSGFKPSMNILTETRPVESSHVQLRNHQYPQI